jgi:hypothetical protein
MKRLVTCHLLVVTAMLLAALVSAPAFAHSRHLDPAAPANFSAMPTPPQTTIRQQIVDEFKRRLAKIDSQTAPLANGYQYQTDIGKNPIGRWVTHSNQDLIKKANGKALLSVFDLVRTRTKGYADEKSIAATLQVQVRAFHFQELEPDTLTKMLGDIQQAIVTDPDTGQRDLRLNGLAVDVKPIDDGFIIPTATFQIDGLAVSFEVEHHIEPYAQ